jgi:YesN/AraC family two-component response regulator
VDNIDVMLVDDEILAIEDLRDLIDWNKYGYNIIAEATNGRQALKLYKKYKPKVIIVDINMPVMDGLEFSRRVISSGDSTKIILLTAYRDFEYAQKAIEIGVSNYILKHQINEESLVIELNKVRQKLQKEQRKNRIVRKQFIKDILRGKLSEETNKEYINEVRKNFALLLINIDMPYPVIDGVRTLKKISYNKVLDLNDTLPEGISSIDIIEMNEYQGTVFVSMETLYSDKKINEVLYELAAKLQRKFKQQYNETISIAITSTALNVEGITSLYQKAVEAIKYSVFIGREKIFICSDVLNQYEETNIDLEDDFTQVQHKLKELNYKGVSNCINEIFEKIFSNCWSLNSLKKVCKELIDILEHFLKEENLPCIQDMFNQNKLEIELWYDTYNIQQWFLQEFKKSIEKAVNSKFCTYSKKVQQIIRYIHKHYGEDITVDKAAEALEISGVYLSQLFKKETGKTFLKYLTAYRMQIAKDLLETGEYKIYEVSEMVGYKTSQYFSHVFYKVTGINPLQYKQGGSSNENVH